MLNRLVEEKRITLRALDNSKRDIGIFSRRDGGLFSEPTSIVQLISSKIPQPAKQAVPMHDAIASASPVAFNARALAYRTESLGIHKSAFW